jgi:hypothetical protein
VDSGSEEEDCKCQNCTLNIESGREQTKEDWWGYKKKCCIKNME